MPALLTRTSTGPSSCVVRSTSVATVGFVCDVAADGDRPHAQPLDLGTHGLQLVAGAGGQGKVRTRARQRSGDVHPNAAATCR